MNEIIIDTCSLPVVISGAYEVASVPFGDCKTDLKCEADRSYTLVFLDRFLIDAE